MTAPVVELRAVPERLRGMLPALADLIADPVEPSTWHGQAVCRNFPPDTWFPDYGRTAQAPREACAGCPVQLRCLAEAARNNERYGVWGGAIPREITAVRVALGLTADVGATDEHCANGHPWTDDTLAFSAAGVRWCRQCNREAKRDEMRRKRARRAYTVAVDGRHRTAGTA